MNTRIGYKFIYGNLILLISILVRKIILKINTDIRDDVVILKLEIRLNRHLQRYSFY